MGHQLGLAGQEGGQALPVIWYEASRSPKALSAELCVVITHAAS